MTADVQPPRLPTSEAELVDWSVYADYLLTKGDRRGELMAIDLALPAEVAPDDVVAYQTKARASCPLHAATTRVAWCLGHVRTLDILGTYPIAIRRDAGPADGTLANVAANLASPIYRCLAQLEIVYYPNEHARHWRRLFAALPPSCRELVVALARDATGATGAQLAELIAMLPPQITTLGITELPRQPDARRDVIAALVSDRFELVQVSRGHVLGDAVLAELAAALAQTRTVRVRTNVLAGPQLADPRFELGSGDAAYATDRVALGFRRWSPLALQDRYGYIPIRAQLAAALPEGHDVYATRDGWTYVNHGSALVRRGTAWTLKGEASTFVDEVAVAPDRIVPLPDGCRVRHGEVDGHFFVRDATLRARALARIAHDRRG